MIFSSVNRILIIWICSFHRAKSNLATEAFSRPPGAVHPPPTPATTTTTTTTTTTGNTTSASSDTTTTTSSTLPTRIPVAIAGGGLGGLALCAALRSRGVDAHVFESSPSLVGRGSTGTGIMISKNGWKALGVVDGGGAAGEGGVVDGGIVSKMRSYGTLITRQTVTKTAANGTAVSTFGFDSTGMGQYNIGWTRAHEVLLESVPPEAIHCGCRFRSYRVVHDGDGGDAVDVTFEDGRSVRASLFVGADGAGSRVRRLVAEEHHRTPEAAAASHETRYAGQLLWNAIVPTNSLPLSDDGAPVHGGGEVEYVVTADDGRVVLAFDAGEGQTSWYLTLLESDVDRLSENDGAGSAPAAVRDALADGTFGGFSRPGVKAQLEELFRPYPTALRCLRATPEERIFERRLADRPPLAKWADEKRRVVLVGDAAHPMVPSQGQGTMVTWEDAADLAVCVAPSLVESGGGGGGVGGKKLSRGVDRYVKRRAKRCARVQRYSALTYMGCTTPTFYPRKILRMLWRKRNMDFIIGGYEPIEEEGGVAKNGKMGKWKRLMGMFKLSTGK